MYYNDNHTQYSNGELEEMFVGIISKLCNSGFSPLITNDFSSWHFQHNFGVNLKEDAISEPHEVLELHVLNALLNCQSFNYWDDEYPTETVDGLLEITMKLSDKNGIEIIKKTIYMPVIYSIMYMKDNDCQWHFDSFVSNDGCCFEGFDNHFDIATSLNNYDTRIQIDSPKQVIFLSTHDRVRRMNRLLFQTWEFD